MVELWWSCLGLIAMTWIIYPAILGALSRLVAKPVRRADAAYAPISVVIAAHNEAKNLGGRLRDIYAGSYPAHKVEVVVASDGSTDDTRQVMEELVKHYPHVTLIDIQPQGGRSNAHNLAIANCRGEILVFTDAETQFDTDFLKKITAPFSFEEVGFASGMLKYRNQGISAVTESAGFYWHFEYFLRQCESKLGIYAFGSGACCAVRKALYREIPATGDVDFTTPLDVVLQGKKCVHVSDAIAYDEMPDSPQREFRARVRMTSKNLYGTLMRWGWRALFMHPIYSLVIFLHKIGRWLTPFGMLGLLVTNLFLFDDAKFYFFMMFGQFFFYGFALAGYFGIRLPLAGQCYSFCLANAGFFLGVINAIRGKVPKAYKPIGQT